jgi:hypothetical protein
VIGLLESSLTPLSGLLITDNQGALQNRDHCDLTGAFPLLRKSIRIFIRCGMNVSRMALEITYRGPASAFSGLSSVTCWMPSMEPGNITPSPTSAPTK